jgi:hypothetical protein
VKTEDLIAALAADVAPAPSRRVPLGMALVGLAGGAIALGLMAAWLGFRPDLAQAVRGPIFWMKAIYALALGVAGFLAIERLARPAGEPRRGLILALAAIGVLGVLGLAQIMTLPADQRLAAWLGASWRVCPRNILILSIPMLALCLFVVRRFGPTRLSLAGAASGLFAGGVATIAYGLHCPETAPAFVATWYTIGMILPTALGALAGPFVLRWR